MKVAVIGATGRVGPRIVSELSQRGHAVTAISKHPEEIEPLPEVSAHYGDANDPSTYRSLLQGQDVVVSSIQFGKIDAETIIRTISQVNPARYFVVGGSGTLLVPGTRTRIMDTAEFPPEFAKFAASAATFFARLQQEKNLNWTYLSPPPGIGDGERTGQFRLGLNEVLMKNGEFTRISFADYAVAFVDEIESPQHAGRRFTVGY